MKKILFASTAAGLVAAGGMASAQGVTVFGDARIGLGYNVLNNGAADQTAIEGVDPVTGDDAIIGWDTPDELRVLSRVRFGVRMTGETTNGIAFGATIRADNAGGGRDGTAGSTFVSGIYGTLTGGDTNGADEQHVGDVVGVGLTGLGDLNETFFLSNGGSFGPDDTFSVAADQKRPTLRYDFDFGTFGFPGLGLSVSTDRRVKDVVVGGSYSFDLGDGNSVGLGLGYADINRGVASDPLGTPFLADNIEQLSAMVEGSFAGISAKVVYTDASAGTADPALGEDEFTTYSVGLGYSFGEIGVTGYYHKVDSAGGRIANFDGRDAYGGGFTYDLGGGATLAGGVARTFGRAYTNAVTGAAEVESATVADFGIRMAF